MRQVELRADVQVGGKCGQILCIKDKTIRSKSNCTDLVLRLMADVYTDLEKLAVWGTN